MNNYKNSLLCFFALCFSVPMVFAAEKRTIPDYIKTRQFVANILCLPNQEQKSPFCDSYFPNELKKIILEVYVDVELGRPNVSESMRSITKARILLAEELLLLKEEKIKIEEQLERLKAIERPFLLFFNPDQNVIINFLEKDTRVMTEEEAKAFQNLGSKIEFFLDRGEEYLVEKSDAKMVPDLVPFLKKDIKKRVAFPEIMSYTILGACAGMYIGFLGVRSAFYKSEMMNHSVSAKTVVPVLTKVAFVGALAGSAMYLGGGLIDSIGRFFTLPSSARIKPLTSSQSASRSEKE